MSERGSFVTEYVYCDRCFAAVARHLLDWPNVHGHDFSLQVADLPIIAGKIGQTWPGGEVFDMEYDVLEKLAPELCHPLRVAVLGESGWAVFVAVPPMPDGAAPAEIVTVGEGKENAMDYDGWCKKWGGSRRVDKPWPPVPS